MRIGTRRKYRNTVIIEAGVRWDSKKELVRWQVLYARFKAGQIKGLRRQRTFRFIINGLHVCSYVADFVYFEAGRFIIEDVKSPMTRKLREYRIKVKLLRAIYGLDVREI